MKKYDIDDNEEIELLEKERDFEISREGGKIIIGVDTAHSDFSITTEEDEQLTLEKRQAEADEELNDLNEDYARGIGEII